LIAEGISHNKIFITGNTVIDSLHLVIEKIKSYKTMEQTIRNTLKNNGYDITCLDRGKKLVLITGHRRENFGDGFIQLCSAIKTLAITYPNVDFVYPMHLNPNVRIPIRKVFGEQTFSNMFFIEPLTYLSFVYLMEKSNIVLTDSGGIQEEAPSLGKPVLVMRNITERPEALKAGTVKLVGTDYTTIIREVSDLLNNEASYLKMSKAVNPYGDGMASERIIKVLSLIE
jgi:UDP-N-acetylglucosamine 2-epimerase (non-hydrolysing)